jgi:transcriptional regulator with XRE-family HTH domain
MSILFVQKMNCFFYEHFLLQLWIRKECVLVSFSKKLKGLREQKGLSQEALAEKLNIPRSTVTNYENNNDRMPRHQRLKEIADFFGVTVDYLMSRSDTEQLNPLEESLLEDIDKLSLEEIISKHKPKLDGKPVTEEELHVLIAVIRSLRVK